MLCWIFKWRQVFLKHFWCIQLVKNGKYKEIIEILKVASNPILGSWYNPLLLNNLHEIRTMFRPFIPCHLDRDLVCDWSVILLKATKEVHYQRYKYIHWPPKGGLNLDYPCPSVILFQIELTGGNPAWWPQWLILCRRVLLIGKGQGQKPGSASRMCCYVSFNESYHVYVQAGRKVVGL